MNEYKIEKGKVYKGEDVVLVSKEFLERTIAEKILLNRTVNYLLMSEDIPDSVKKEIVSLIGEHLIDVKEKPYCWVGL